MKNGGKQHVELDARPPVKRRQAFCEINKMSLLKESVYSLINLSVLS